MYSNKKISKKSVKKRNILIAVLVILFAITGAFFYYNKVRHTNKTVTTGSSYTKGQTDITNQPNSPNPTTSTKNENTPTTSATTNTTSNTNPPITPTGDFVSNHTPGQNGSPLTETSVCNTTPGATCTIIFTMGSETKSLPTKTVDSGGSAYWNNWLPSQYGITYGSWSVKATANINGQSVSNTDAMQMVVTK
jgi:hypothetical protein